MAKDIKAKVVTKPTGKQHGGNGTAKVVKAIKAKSSGKVNTPPKEAVPMKMKMGGMTKSKKSC